MINNFQIITLIRDSSFYDPIKGIGSIKIVESIQMTNPFIFFFVKNFESK